MAGTADNSKKQQLLYSNPEEIASVVRQQTLIVDASLSRAGESENEMTHPLKVYSAYSRFVFTIINPSKEGTAATSAMANLRPASVPGILAATKFAYQKHMEALYQPKHKKDNVSSAIRDMLRSDAFTVHILTPPFSGCKPGGLYH